jgi:hypothetical protein
MKCKWMCDIHQDTQNKVVLNTFPNISLRGWGYCSMVERVSSINEALGLIQSTGKKNEITHEYSPMKSELN